MSLAAKGLSLVQSLPSRLNLKRGYSETSFHTRSLICLKVSGIFSSSHILLLDKPDIHFFSPAASTTKVVKSFSLRPSHLVKPKFKIRNMNLHPNQTPINLALPIQICHLPQRIQNHRNVRPAKQILCRMKIKRDGTTVVLKVLDGRQAAPGARFGADQADAFEDAHFGRRIRGWGGDGVRLRISTSVSQARCLLKGASGQVPRWRAGSRWRRYKSQQWRRTCVEYPAVGRLGRRW